MFPCLRTKARPATYYTFVYIVNRSFHKLSPSLRSGHMSFRVLLPALIITGPKSAPGTLHEACSLYGRQTPVRSAGADSGRVPATRGRQSTASELIYCGWYSLVPCCKRLHRLWQDTIPVYWAYEGNSRAGNCTFEENSVLTSSVVKYTSLYK